MSEVYITTYELVGAGVDKAKEHYRKCDEAVAEHWRFVESIGGLGMRPDHNGGVRSVFFREVPTGWRKVGREGDKLEAVPNKGTKAGKAMLTALEALPRAPRPSELASAVGYNPPEMAMDGARGIIYFPTELHVLHPIERCFVRLPRFAKDRFAPDEAELRPIPESELMKAVEDHNAEAQRVRQKEAA